MVDYSSKWNPTTVPWAAVDSLPVWQPGALPLSCFEMNAADALPIPLAVRDETMLHTLGTYLHLPRIWYTIPEGIMQNSKAEKLRKLASKRQIVRAKDARELGIPRTYLSRLARRGDLEKVGRGLYSSRDFSGTENTSLIEAAYQIPKGIVCLLSALRFHNFTTQSPHEVWMAIDHKAWAPKISSSPIRIVRMSGACPSLWNERIFYFRRNSSRVFPGKDGGRLLQISQQGWTRCRHRSPQGMSPAEESLD